MIADGAIWRRVLVPLAVSRALMLVGVVAALWFGSAVAGVSLIDTVHRIFYDWDGISYVKIAAHGYSTTPDPAFAAKIAAGHFSPRLNALDAFLPGYPLAIAAVSTFTGHDPIVAGLIVSLGAEAVALYYIYRLVAQERDANAAGFATWAMALAPFAFFMGAVYTESMFIASAAASLYYMRAGRFREASVATAIACATRITGVALLVALAFEYIRLRGTHWRSDVLWLLLAPLPLVGYTAYMAVHTGDPLAMLHANTVYFDHDFASPWSGFWNTWGTFTGTTGNDAFVFFRELAFGVGGVVACVAVWFLPRFPRSFAAYCTAVVAMAICISFWRSVPRYELALFPMLMVVTDITQRRRELAGALIGVGAVGFVWGTILFAQGWWLA